MGDLTLNLCQRLGVRVIRVTEELPAPILYVEEDSIAFVSAGLTADELTEAADWLLSRSCVVRATS